MDVPFLVFCLFVFFTFFYGIVGILSAIIPNYDKKLH